jgi:hypothetical protein
MRAQIRLIVCGVVVVVIAVATIVEPPGTGAAILYVLVIMSMVLTIYRELAKQRS